MQGLIGRKLGMTQVFDAQGRRVPVTVLEAGPCLVVQRKTQDRDGYEAAQLGFHETIEKRVSRPRVGAFKKLGKAPCRFLKEFGLDDGETVAAGDVVTAAIFAEAGFVDVCGMTKGRGFQGVVKRHRMAGGRMTHGGHSKRRVGSIGQCELPGRVAKGRRLPGQMGHRRVTAQNLRIVEVRDADNILLVEGAVPGATGSVVEIRKAVKKAGKAS
jgi:large subunit ribosomal protein L3